MVLPTLPTFLELKKVNFNQEYLKIKHASDFDRKYVNENNLQSFYLINILLITLRIETLILKTSTLKI